MTHYENIPNELRQLNQWVCARGDNKLPFLATAPDMASSTDPSTWSSYDTALSAVSGGHYDYCGFTFADNGIVGIDIDDGVDEDGFLTTLSADIIGKCGSYTEKSKSGTGFHILVKGDLPFRGRNNLAGVEIYKDARYFIMTGNTMLYQNIVENQSAIDYVLEKYFPNCRESKDTMAGTRIYTPVWRKPENNRIPLRPHYPEISNGGRNICLTSLAGVLHNQGFTKSQIYDELCYCNKISCKPMLDKYEIQTICNSVTRYIR